MTLIDYNDVTNSKKEEFFPYEFSTCYSHLEQCCSFQSKQTPFKIITNKINLGFIVYFNRRFLFFHLFILVGG